MTDSVELRFTDPSGDELRFEWPIEALEAIAPGAAGGEPAWRLGGELDWDELETVRLISGRLDDGRLLAVAALRPAGASGHGEEIVVGALGSADGFEQLTETLLSTEYGADGAPTRVGLELYPSSDGLAVRVAGTAGAPVSAPEGGIERLSAPLDLRAGGGGGAGVLDVLRSS